MKKELNYIGGWAPYCGACIFSSIVELFSGIKTRGCSQDVMGIHHTKPFYPCSRLKFHEKDEEALKNCLKGMAKLLGDEIEFTEDEK